MSEAFVLLFITLIFTFGLETRGCNAAVWPQGGSREPWVVETEVNPTNYPLPQRLCLREKVFEDRK